MQIANGYLYECSDILKFKLTFCLLSLNVFYAVTECVDGLQKVSNMNRSCTFVSNDELNLLRQSQHLRHQNPRTSYGQFFSVLHFPDSWGCPPHACTHLKPDLWQMGFTNQLWNGRTVRLFLCTNFYFQQSPALNLSTTNSWNCFVDSLKFSWPLALCINNIWFHK